jgi:hypothetical protein
MKNTMLLGVRQHLVPVPGPIWRREVAKNAKAAINNLGFMSQEHHQVRDFVVCEIPRVGKPLSPAFIAGELGLPLSRVGVILDELEKGMTFLFRNTAGEVAWAYPVTSDDTPHLVKFSSGEQVHAA